MKMTQLIGKEVMDSEAKVIGYVKDIEIDLKKWGITGLVVKTGFIKRLTVPTGDIDKIGDKVVLKVTLGKARRD